MKTLLIVVNVDWFFISHRLEIAKAAMKEGWRVVIACEDTGRSNEITKYGIEFINLPFSRSGTNPFAELKVLASFYKLYQKVKPDVIHHVTLKPVVYGSLMARYLKTPAVLNAVSGLGYVFTENRKGLIPKMMKMMMKRGFKHKNLSFIFQNKDDEQEMKSLGVINSYNTINIIKGSGVDLSRYLYSEPNKNEQVLILLPTRMLWDKGVGELKKASEILREKYKGKIKFILVGMADNDNKAGVPEYYLKEWEEDGYVEWIGYQKNMISVYENADIVVLPSYREGMPKSLIEACAIGRPIVTTEAIGCRECVDEGLNGFKIPVKATVELAKALEKLINNDQLRIDMGIQSRKKAEKEFDQNKVIEKHLEIYKQMIE